MFPSTGSPEGAGSPTNRSSVYRTSAATGGGFPSRRAKGHRKMKIEKEMREKRPVWCGVVCQTGLTHPLDPVGAAGCPAFEFDFHELSACRMPLTSHHRDGPIERVRCFSSQRRRCSARQRRQTFLGANTCCSPTGEVIKWYVLGASLPGNGTAAVLLERFVTNLVWTNWASWRGVRLSAQHLIRRFDGEQYWLSGKMESCASSYN